MIIPINQNKEGVLDKAFELKEKLSSFRVKVDDSDKSPGWKFSEQEMRGVPIRIEIGPKDMEANQAVIVRRDTREKLIVSLDEIDVRAGEILESMQSEMLERARTHRDTHTYTAINMDELEKTVAEKPGFIKAMWCQEEACEKEIKEKTGATSRCMPFEQEHIADTCVCCGKPATTMTYWGKAY
jgi:prolyl-tRNA synthetase